MKTTGSSSEKYLKGLKKPETVQMAKNEEILRLPIEDVLGLLDTSQAGLTLEEVESRLETYGPNDIVQRKERTAIIEFLSHFRNPLVLLLVAAALISSLLGEHVNSTIIFIMVLGSVILDFLQKYRAEKAADELRKRVATIASVLRDASRQDIEVTELVPGDIIFLAAGDIVPADARVISAKDFFVDQSALTGESFPAEKIPGPLREKDLADINTWNNYLFMGTSVATGTSVAVIVKTGAATQYGAIIRKIVGRRADTEFERGLRRFGFLIMQVTFVLVLFVFFVNALLKRDIMQSMLFSVALAVGMTPELLPMILSINLSKGAISMSKKGVIVKRLSSIQNFGSMDVLCTDKTGTLTENRVTVILHVDIEGNNDEKVFLYSFLNSSYQTGLRSPLDDAVLKHKEVDITNYRKIDEIPFDFVRRRTSVVVNEGQVRFILTKGAPEQVVAACSYYELGKQVSDLNVPARREIRKIYRRLSSEGFRILGIAYKKVNEDREVYSVHDESKMVFLGFLAFIDPPKETAKESLDLLKNVSIELKVLTGDNELVTKNICEQLGFDIKQIVLGNRIDRLNDDALAMIVEEANIFARVTPAQKNRIINAIKGNGHVVGFLGDGINDTPSMKVADVSISVENAVDIAKEAADIILLHKDLKVLEEGVLEGRKTFVNTLKYIMMGMSSNFGNMLSAAAASLFLPFLPMLPVQVLLNNFLYDLSQLTIPTDSVDIEFIQTAKKLDITFIRKFMMFFGPISSMYDLLTFFVLLYVFRAPEQLFQTAWFVESLFTQTLVIFAIRTMRVPFLKSRSSRFLVWNIAGVLFLALMIPFTPIGDYFQFVHLPVKFMAILAVFILTYLMLVEVVKIWFYRRYAFGTGTVPGNR
ncbi:MAG: magnesium-translocating P-type ATPase [Chloroflexota bacterium]